MDTIFDNCVKNTIYLFQFRSNWCSALFDWFPFQRWETEQEMKTTVAKTISPIIAPVKAWHCQWQTLKKCEERTWGKSINTQRSSNCTLWLLDWNRRSKKRIKLYKQGSKVQKIVRYEPSFPLFHLLWLPWRKLSCGKFLLRCWIISQTLAKSRQKDVRCGVTR